MARIKGIPMHSIRYRDTAESLRPEQLHGFRTEWLRPPSPETTLRSLQRMNAVVVALDEEADRAVGFACGFTDQTLLLYIWDVEVLPKYRGQGIDEELVRQLVAAHELYQINTITQPERRGLFERLGFREYDSARHGPAMTLMRMAWQDGGPNAVK